MDPIEELEQILAGRLRRLQAVAYPKRVHRRGWELADDHHIVRFHRQHPSSDLPRRLDMVNDYYRARHAVFMAAGIAEVNWGSWSSDTRTRQPLPGVTAVTELARHVYAFLRSFRYR